MQVRDQIDVVFESPEMVTTRFIQAIFEKVLSVRHNGSLLSLVDDIAEAHHEHTGQANGREEDE